MMAAADKTSLIDHSFLDCDSLKQESLGKTASKDAEAASPCPTGPIRPTTQLFWYRKLAYGVGHVFNDLCASMWFTYLILFYHKVLKIDNALAGTLLLVGQLADGLATPVIGYLCDITPFWLMGFGRRKIWHLIGTVMVSVSLFFFWHHCLPCELGKTNPLAGQVVWYCVFIIIFQVGWASVQISHLSLIPELTEDENERVGLNAIRTSFTILANLGVFVSMWVLLDVFDSGAHISRKDEWIFSGMILGIIVVGLIFSLIFHIGTIEPCSRAQQREERRDGRRISWYRWFTNPHFYLVAGIYMGTRLVVNISQVYAPLYLVDSLYLAKESVAIGPLTVYVSGFLATLLLRLINKVVGRYMTYFCGLALTWAACMWFWQQVPPSETAHAQIEQVTVYGSTVLLGAGSSTLLVTSLSMVADLIGTTVGSGAFVYGLMSFTDKLSNGIAVQVVQLLHPCKSSSPSNVCCKSCKTFYRTVLSAVPAGASVFALICLALLSIYIYRRSRQCSDVSPVCNNNQPCLSPTSRNKTLQDNDACSSLSQTASLNGRVEVEETERKPLLKRTPLHVQS